MSKVIEGVPESITRAAYIKLFESIGIDPRQTLEISLKADGVYATVFALNEESIRTIDNAGNGFNKHIIYIPVKDEV
ncbi:hypothetical protein NIBR502772_06120 [Pseudarthrobacter sp. NIBRBAC000502772]|uniref:hypothetical protein n=1 Tax=Pseudarthrobacter sp. NIBRBAC000502772 TaxID=2590775 RepID=UPI001130B2B9|nr:hypothetical protein [Pseudarthrobacter sp. NIBRBAC000502772]QDG65848.1 hypothetical protein NIBR502772_06120 [Pseudarthrobacter sp. NIBRBAC000502772]